LKQESATAPATLGRPPSAGNTLLNLTEETRPLVVTIAAIPFIIRGLCPARRGIPSLVRAGVGYASILDLGPGRAATRRVAESPGQDEGGVIPQVASRAVFVQTITGVFVGLLLATIAPRRRCRLRVSDFVVPMTRVV